MVKYFKYKGDSWVGYDDAETYAMKEAFANDKCLVSNPMNVNDSFGMR